MILHTATPMDHSTDTKAMPRQLVLPVLVARISTDIFLGQEARIFSRAARPWFTTAGPYTGATD